MQVSEVKKRKQKQAERDRKAWEKQQEKDREAKEAAAKIKQEHDSYEVKVVAPLELGACV